MDRRAYQCSTFRPPVSRSGRASSPCWKASSRIHRPALGSPAAEPACRPPARSPPPPTASSGATAAALIDEYRLVVHPVVLGGGTPFFPALDNTISLRLVETRTFGSGVVLPALSARAGSVTAAILRRAPAGPSATRPTPTGELLAGKGRAMPACARAPGAVGPGVPVPKMRPRPSPGPSNRAHGPSLCSSHD